MIVWYILAAVAALVAIFLALPWTLTIKLTGEGDMGAKARIAGIPFWQSPKKQKKIRLRDYTPRAMRRRARKEEKAARSKKTRGSQVAASFKSDTSLTEKISFIKDIALDLLSHSLSRAHVRVKRLTVTVGSPDAARTAILYGAIAPALALLLEALEQFSHLHISQDVPVGAAVDFTADRIQAEVNIRFRLHTLHLISALLRGAFRAFIHMKNSTQTKKDHT